MIFLFFRKIRALLLLLISFVTVLGCIVLAECELSTNTTWFFWQKVSVGEIPVRKREVDREHKRVSLYATKLVTIQLHILFILNIIWTHICLLSFQAPAWRSCWGMNTLRRSS